MARVLDAGKTHPDRTVLSNRFRSTRYLPVIAMGLMGWIMVTGNAWNAWTLGLMAGFAALYYLVTHTKRAQFDDHALYFLERGREEEKIPFTDITAIKATGTKVNSRTMWRIEYKDRDGLPRKYRFLPRTIFFWPYSSSKIVGWPTDFLDAVTAANPDVTVWWHPFFFHDQPWRERVEQESPKT